jgi:hypothetical protein
MEGISDIRITGIDEKRPPRIRKEPYIDLVFRLAHKAPDDWCRDFNDLMSKHEYAPKINLDECLYIETWVRGTDEIGVHLQLLKDTVAQCTGQYIEKIRAHEQNRSDGNDLLQKEEGAQGRLNRIIAGLDFDT